jgi:hypothetical protein
MAELVRRDYDRAVEADPGAPPSDEFFDVGVVDVPGADGFVGRGPQPEAAAAR